LIRNDKPGAVQPVAHKKMEKNPMLPRPLAKLFSLARVIRARAGRRRRALRIPEWARAVPDERTMYVAIMRSSQCRGGRLRAFPSHDSGFGRACGRNGRAWIDDRRRRPPLGLHAPYISDKVRLAQQVPARAAPPLDYITGTAVLEFGPAETLSPIGAMSPAYRCFCRPRHFPWPAHPRENPGFSTAARCFP